MAHPGPAHVAVIGGGRWARVLLDVLAELLPPTSTLSVHSASAREALGAWREGEPLRWRIEIGGAWPEIPSHGSAAIIVANATRDHAAATRRALESGWPVLVEKPLAARAAEARELVATAGAVAGQLAAAQVLLFARHVENFLDRVAAAGPVDALECEWADPAGEVRYGEVKRYDPAMPVYADCLPHLVPIIRRLLRRLPESAMVVSLRRGGAEMELALEGMAAPCRIRLARTAPSRRRLIRARVGSEDYELDFSVEPGRVTVAGISGDADPDWNAQPRPLARLLRAYLDGVSGGLWDGRFTTDDAVRSCELTEQLKAEYERWRDPWLARQLQERTAPLADVRYALLEMLAVQGRWPRDEIERVVDKTLAGPGRDLSTAGPNALTHLPAAAQFLRIFVRETLSGQTRD